MKSGFLPRPRVDAYLRDAVSSARLTVLQAPLGAGKSAAASTAFADEPNVVWLQAEPWHRGAFVSALVNAVREARPEFGRLTLGAVEAGASSTHLGKVFAQELGHIDEPLLLIVDNVHVFKEESGFARFIEAAVSAAPAAVRLLALGRSLPDIALGQSLARGHVRILDGAFLAFDATDVRMLADLLDRDVDDARVEQILEWTEGWAAGVALALTAPDMPAPGNAGPRAWAERYLTKQLLARLRPECVAFLEETAIFETLDAHVLESVTGASRMNQSIADLRRAGALVTQTRPHAYRVHPVLRELAQARLDARGGSARAHAAASRAYAQTGAIAAAMFHAGLAADPYVSVHLLRQHADAALATGDHDTLRALSLQIDPQGPDADVRSYADALVEKVRGSQQAREAFARAAKASLESGDRELYFKARRQVLEYDLGRSLRVDADALEDLRRRSSALGLRGAVGVAVLEGWTHAIAHEFTQALACVAPFTAVDDPAVQFNAGILRAYAQTALGDADSAENTLDALVRALENGDRVVMQTLTLVWFARLELVLGRVTNAADAALQAARLAERLDLRAEEAALYAAIAEVATHTGDVQRAVSAAERAKGRSEYAWYAADVTRVRAFGEIALARAAFLGHDNAIARDLALRVANDAAVPPVQRAVALSECTVYTLLCEPAAASVVIAQARDAIASARPLDAADAVALAVSDDVLAFLDAANGKVHAPSIQGCDAFADLLAFRRGLVTLEHAGIAAGKARRNEASAEAFDTALAQLTREGPRFEARLARAYVASFIKSKKLQEAPVQAFDFTPREGEILALLVEGLTNKEIAQRLVLSPRTVETHVERVLGKMEVGSRSRAIAKALRLGLVNLA